MHRLQLLEEELEYVWHSDSARVVPRPAVTAKRAAAVAESDVEIISLGS